MPDLCYLTAQVLNLFTLCTHFWYILLMTIAQCTALGDTHGLGAQRRAQCELEMEQKHKNVELWKASFFAVFQEESKAVSKLCPTYFAVPEISPFKVSIELTDAQYTSWDREENIVQKRPPFNFLVPTKPMTVF